MAITFLSFWFVGFCFWKSPSGAQGLVLVLHSRTGGFGGTILCNKREFRLAYRQANTLSTVPSFTFFPFLWLVGCLVWLGIIPQEKLRRPWVASDKAWLVVQTLEFCFDPSIWEWLGAKDTRGRGTGGAMEGLRAYGCQACTLQLDLSPTLFPILLSLGVTPSDAQ